MTDLNNEVDIFEEKLRVWEKDTMEELHHNKIAVGQYRTEVSECL